MEVGVLGHGDVLPGIKALEHQNISLFLKHIEHQIN